MVDAHAKNALATSGAEVLGFLRRSVDEFGQTIIMVTHDQHIAEYGDKIIHLLDGRITDIAINGTTQAKQNEPQGSGN